MKVIKYLREGRKLQAMKEYKESTGKSLKEAKDYVDKLCKKYLNKSKFLKNIGV